MAKHTVVTLKELGSNCWHSHFIKGNRCDRVFTCDYPEKKTCKAVGAEIVHLCLKRDEMDRDFQAKIDKLIAEKGD